LPHKEFGVGRFPWPFSVGVKAGGQALTRRALESERLTTDLDTDQPLRGRVFDECNRGA
jgi:hypothetical protein